MKNNFLVCLLAFSVFSNIMLAQSGLHVGLYKTFEQSIENKNAYKNKFNDVELTCTYESPSSKKITFMGFFDGNGNGGGDSITGNIWKIRFLTDEIGEWKYSWKWSDGTKGGKGTFVCDSENAGKGVLRPYKDNPHWFAYNGTEPVWLKSYYETGHGAIAQPFDWITSNVYQPLIDNGYNHLQVNWLLSLCCFNQYYYDGPPQSTQDLALYEFPKPSSTMRLDVWKMMEQHVDWLNDRNVGLHMFLGFDGSKNGTAAWAKLSEEEKDFYVRYVVARLAPYANIAGWNYVWEVPGDRLTHELGWAKLVKKYDVFDHLRTYQDEKPAKHEFERPEYNFAGVENHSMLSMISNEERQVWKEPWTHHYACLAGYVPGKPVYMIEGNSLWRRYWAAQSGASKDELRQSAWACVTAGASFNWCGHEGVGPLKAFGPHGLPFYGDINEYAASSNQIDILANTMNNEFYFHKMVPSDLLLSNHDSMAVWCLSEPGEQYLVFSIKGKPFELQLSKGKYKSNQWLNAITGAGKEVKDIEVKDNETVSFTPPDTIADWVLLIRKQWDRKILSEAHILSAKTDPSGSEIYLECDKEIYLPSGYKYGFKIREKGRFFNYSIKDIKKDKADKKKIVIEMKDTICLGKEIKISYWGTLHATDESMLALVNNLPVINNSVTEASNIDEDLANKINLNIFYNRSTRQLEVSSDIKMNMVQVLDANNNVLLEKKDIDRDFIHIFMFGFPKGKYMLSVKADNNTFNKEFVK